MKLVIGTNTEIQLQSASQLIKSIHQKFYIMLHTNIFLFLTD
jgi:hypothetical protein